MADAYATLCARIRALPGIREGEGRFGTKPAFFRGTREFAHFHGRKEIDIRLTAAEARRRGDALWETPALAVNPYSKDWVIVGMRGCDVDRTMALVRAAYVRAVGTAAKRAPRSAQPGPGSRR